MDSRRVTFGCVKYHDLSPSSRLRAVVPISTNDSRWVDHVVPPKGANLDWAANDIEAEAQSKAVHLDKLGHAKKSCQVISN